jgi:excisionase family DNA binding protein
MARSKPPDRIGISEAAKILAVDHCTVRRFIASGKLPAYRVGDRLIRINRADVDKLLVPVPVTDKS